MFGPNMADKYALATTKNLCLVHNYRRCTPGNFLVMYQSFVKTYHYIDILYVFDACMKAPEKTGAVTYIPKNCLQIPLFIRSFDAYLDPIA